MFSGLFQNEVTNLFALKMIFLNKYISQINKYWNINFLHFRSEWIVYRYNLEVMRKCENERGRVRNERYGVRERGEEREVSAEDWSRVGSKWVKVQKRREGKEEGHSRSYANMSGES